MRCHTAWRLNPGLCRNANRQDRDQRNQDPAEMAAPDHDYFGAAGGGGAGLVATGADARCAISACALSRRLRTS
jgi:hypothetical protein